VMTSSLHYGQGTTHSMVCRGLDQDLLDVEEDILLGGGGDQDPNAKVWSVAM
jgi:hypothetical protein